MNKNYFFKDVNPIPIYRHMEFYSKFGQFWDFCFFSMPYCLHTLANPCLWSLKTNAVCKQLYLCHVVHLISFNRKRICRLLFKMKNQGCDCDELIIPVSGRGLNRIMENYMEKICAKINGQAGAELCQGQHSLSWLPTCQSCFLNQLWLEKEVWVSCSLESYPSLTTNWHGRDKLAEPSFLLAGS